MIHHISVAANNPEHVAAVLAELCQGQAVTFPPNPGSYMVVVQDKHGTAIEIYPSGSQIVPGSGLEGCSFRCDRQNTVFTAVHAAISVPVSQAKIEEIGAREGWRVVRCNRDSLFDVIEFWVENNLMLELLTLEMTGKYLAAVQEPEVLKSFGVERIVAAA